MTPPLNTKVSNWVSST